MHCRKYSGFNVSITTFNQSRHPRINKESLMPVAKSWRTEENIEAWYPPGHGVLYRSFSNNNLGATVDLNILNMVMSGGLVCQGQVWESLVPMDKWRTVHRNVQAGDIVLVRYTSKVTKPEFRLGQVSKVFPDQHRVVRDVEVITRSRRGKMEDLLEYKPRKFDEQKLPVQRLAVMLPLEEQDGLPPADDALHLCEDDMRVPDLAEIHARPAPIGPNGPTDSDLNVPPTSALIGPLGPTDPSLNVPPTPEETEDTEAVVQEPARLQAKGVFQVLRTDTSEFITKLVNHAVVVRSPEYHCSECQVRHNIIYNESYYKQCFESEN